MKRKAKYSGAEFARLGDTVYERHVLPRVTPRDNGTFVAVDVVTGSYEIDDDELKAIDVLLSRYPDAQVWLARVGSRSAHRFGPRLHLERA